MARAVSAQLGTQRVLAAAAVAAGRPKRAGAAALAHGSAQQQGRSALAERAGASARTWRMRIVVSLTTAMWPITPTGWPAASRAARPCCSHAACWLCSSRCLARSAACVSCAAAAALRASSRVCELRSSSAFLPAAPSLPFASSLVFCSP